MRCLILGLLACGLGLGFTPKVAPAVDAPNLSWETARTTVPASVDELKILQNTVKGVVDKVTISTVAVLYGMGAGSGVIVSEDGLVLTAAHVIAPPNPEFKLDTAMIQLSNGARVKAKLLGRNSRWDNGMMQIIDPVPQKADWPGAKEGKWPAVKIADSESIKKGQWIIALGHPGGPKQERRPPVRVGQVVMSLPKQNVIKTDCTLVGGDSGGPLFDMAGALVGIHSRIGLSIDENYHVPTKTFQNDWDDMLAGSIITNSFRPYMGVNLFRKGDDDLRVDSIVPKSPAEKAGFLRNDLLVKFNSKSIPDSETLDAWVGKVTPGTEATVTVERDGKLVELKVKIGRLFEEQPTKSRRK
ncbi:MAG: S1C family serine protease [Gemmataceae bacterium]